jgi:outer membrane immunogenic protein
MKSPPLRWRRLSHRTLDVRGGFAAVRSFAAAGERLRRGLFAAPAVLALVTGAAGAADYYPPPPYYQPAPVPYGYSWMGPYLGANLGDQWGNFSGSGAHPSGVAGGFEGGYNWQFGQFVLGGEADFDFSSSNGVFASYKFSNPWFGTVRGRGGFALNNILFYGTLGLAYGRGHIDQGSLSEGNLHLGWAGGGGLEVGLTRNWSIKAEYLFIDLAGDSYQLTGRNNGVQSNLLRFGVNYRF